MNVRGMPFRYYGMERVPAYGREKEKYYLEYVVESVWLLESPIRDVK